MERTFHEEPVLEQSSTIDFSIPCTDVNVESVDQMLKELVSEFGRHEWRIATVREPVLPEN